MYMLNFTHGYGLNPVNMTFIRPCDESHVDLPVDINFCGSSQFSENLRVTANRSIRRFVASHLWTVTFLIMRKAYDRGVIGL